jgi:hypothetical protein
MSMIDCYRINQATPGMHYRRCLEMKTTRPSDLKSFTKDTNTSICAIESCGVPESHTSGIDQGFGTSVRENLRILARLNLGIYAQLWWEYSPVADLTSVPRMSRKSLPLTRTRAANVHHQFISAPGSFTHHPVPQPQLALFAAPKR